MKKDCLLFSAPNTGRGFPRGLLEIASFLEAKGCSIGVEPLSYYLDTISDTDSRRKQQVSVIERIIKEAKPTVVGVSNQFTRDYPDCLEILKISKKINKDIITVIGGTHVTFEDKECLKSSFVDIVVRGEGEWTMLDLLSAIKNGRDLADVQGITFRGKDKIIRTPDRALGDLNELPPINFGLLPHKFVQNAAVYGMLNRGCSYNCRFCAEKVFWRRRRPFPVQRLINEMKTLKSKYKNTLRGIDDVMLSVGSDQFFELCSQLRRQNINMPPDFYILSRVDTITDEGIESLKKTNIAYIDLGIESASDKVLRMMNKNITFNQVYAACKKLKDNKITINSFWMVGHPGDNPKEAEYSFGVFKDLLAKDLINGASIATFLPVPGTPFFQEPENYEIEILSYDWSKWRQYTYEPICQLKDFSAEEISGFCNKSVSFLREHLPAETYINRKVKSNKFESMPHAACN